ncbi:SDR family NAD(P)-dependent oxidoreductase [Modestobacter roseus]|uniref:SDR family NAD(P)-dependent oxidoreductase n=1 Tax=Modestobacter roseus TaxID=1181884 RepID=UPI0034E038E5
MNEDLHGRTVLLAGATGGVGEGTTRSLLAHGARVVAIGRDEERLAGLADRLGDTGTGELVLHRTDVTAADSSAVTRELRAAFGTVDGAVISIGTPGGRTRGSVLDITDAHWAEMVEGNQTAGFRALRALVPLVAPDGAVVNLLGASAEIPFPGNPLMGATNAALRSLVQTLAVQLSGSGPRVYGLVLGVVRTRARQSVGIDDPRWLTGEQVGDAVGELLTAGAPESDEPLHHLIDPVTGLTVRSSRS